MLDPDSITAHGVEKNNPGIASWFFRPSGENVFDDRGGFDAGKFLVEAWNLKVSFSWSIRRNSLGDPLGVTCFISYGRAKPFLLFCFSPRPFRWMILNRRQSQTEWAGRKTKRKLIRCRRFYKYVTPDGAPDGVFVQRPTVLPTQYPIA
jgi:hypothetical protein